MTADCGLLNYVILYGYSKKIDVFSIFFIFAGLLADEVGSYVPAFYMTGTVLLLAASIIFLAPFIKSETKRIEDVSELLFVVERCTVV